MLVSLHNVVQQLLQLIRAGIRCLSDSFFDVLQADSAGAESADILDRDLAALAADFQPGADFLQQPQLQVPEQLAQLFGEGVE